MRPVAPVMLKPRRVRDAAAEVGFDVVPTACLAEYLKQHLPPATCLTHAFHSYGPAGLPIET